MVGSCANFSRFLLTNMAEGKDRALERAQLPKGVSDISGSCFKGTGG